MPITYEILLKYFTLVSQCTWMTLPVPLMQFKSRSKQGIDDEKSSSMLVVTASNFPYYMNILHDCSNGILEDILNLKKSTPWRKEPNILFNLHQMMSKSVAEFTKQIRFSLFDAKMKWL